MNPEVIMAAGYAGMLLAAAFVLEWLSAHTHNRSQEFRNAGFDYDEQHDLWVCHQGEQLWPKEFDRERRLVRYRAKPSVCNACPLKEECTDSDEGREIVKSFDPWPHSEAGRFHRGIALVLVGLALMILAVEFVRHHEPVEAALLAGVAALSALSAWWLLGAFLNTPSGFPEPKPAHGIGLEIGAGSGSRIKQRWAAEHENE